MRGKRGDAREETFHFEELFSLSKRKTQHPREDPGISFCECGTRGTSCIRDASSWLRHISPCEVCEFALSGGSASFGEVRRGKDL